MHKHYFTLSIAIAAMGSILFSAKAIVVKLCYRYGVDPTTVLALRMLFSLPFFWLAVAWYEKYQSPMPILKKDFWTLFFLGFIGYYASSFLDFIGLQYISVGLERIILYLNPTIVLLISALALKKKIVKTQWVAMGLAYVGVVLVFSHDIHWDGSKVAIGGAFVFASAISYAAYLIFAGEIVNRVGSIRLVAYASASSTFFSVVQALVVHPQTLWIQPIEVYQLSVFNALFCTFIPMLLVMVAVNRVGSGITSQAGMVGPVATVFLGWYFLGESVGWFQLVGMGIVLSGVAILATAKPLKNLRPELSEAE